MKILLSIKPEFVEKIFVGTKKYEFRKSLFKKNNVTHVVVYASAPIKSVVGEFEIIGILSGDVNVIWKMTEKYSGITKDFYYLYFQKRNVANAIQIGRLTKFEKPKKLSDYHINRAPQSFCYISE